MTSSIDSHDESGNGQLPSPVQTTPRISYSMSLSNDASVLYERVPTDGSPVGNTTLSRSVRWQDDRYWAARDELLESGLVIRGRGRGGSIRRIVVAEPANAAMTVSETTSPEQLVVEAAAELRREVTLYPMIRDVILGDFARDRRVTPLAVEITALQGRRSTGGRWSRPDIVSVEVTTYLHLPGRVLELMTFEVKPEDAVDVSAVYEALSHRRSATRSYVVFHVPDDSTGSLEPALEDICEEARSHGIGIIVAGQPDDYETWDERVQAVRHEPDPLRLDNFIATQLTPGTANRIAREVR